MRARAPGAKGHVSVAGRVPGWLENLPEPENDTSPPALSVSVIVSGNASRHSTLIGSGSVALRSSLCFEAPTHCIREQSRSSILVDVHHRRCSPRCELIVHQRGPDERE